MTDLMDNLSQYVLGNHNKCLFLRFNLVTHNGLCRFYVRQDNITKILLCIIDLNSIAHDDNNDQQKI